MSFTTDEQLALYRAYMLELDGYRNGAVGLSEAEIDDDFNAYHQSSDCCWRNVFYDGKIVGFLIVGVSGSMKHPDSVRSICEAYVLPEYRRKHLMTDAVREYVQRNPGIYSLLILPRNRATMKFWRDCFAGIGYHQKTLDRQFLRLSESEVYLFGYGP